LERWLDMDATLCAPSTLDVQEFADKWHISVRTVFRYLEAFRKLDQRTHYDTGSRRLPYRANTRPLFTRNDTGMHK
jgi:hypothetical protein